jgi:hypothetical protein
MTVCGEKVTGVCAMGKCPHIKRCCPVVWDKYGKIEPNTNEEWFCGLSTREKAETISRLSYYHGNIYEIEMWLKQPHTEKE